MFAKQKTFHQTQLTFHFNHKKISLNETTHANFIGTQKQWGSHNKLATE